MKSITIREGPILTGVVTIRAYKAGTKELIREIVQPNMIMQGPNTGLDLIIQRLAGINTYSLNINYGEIGTGSSAATLADTALATPVVRISPTLQQDFGQQQAILQFFFPDNALINQTYHEFGTFIDGTASLGSGQIFNRAILLTPYVKVSGQDTTFQVVYTLSQ